MDEMLNLRGDPRYFQSTKLIFLRDVLEEI